MRFHKQGKVSCLFQNSTRPVWQMVKVPAISINLKGLKCLSINVSLTVKVYRAQTQGFKCVLIFGLGKKMSPFYHTRFIYDIGKFFQTDRFITREKSRKVYNNLQHKQFFATK